MEKKIKTLIVDDSLFIRVMLRKILEKHNDIFEVVGFANNGKEALDFVRSNPDLDLITLDIRMPVMDGLQALREIMKIKKIPVVMISSITKENAKETIQALELGAVDFITKVSGDVNTNFFEIERDIIKTLVTATTAKIRLTHKKVGKTTNAIDTSKITRLICIGSSTGGPNALKRIFSGLNEDFKHPIIVAQHMPEGPYSESLANSINEITHNFVKIAEQGEMIKNNVIYICPGGSNVEILEDGTKYYINLNKRKEGYYLPSVDLLFKSLNGLNKIEKTAVVLTGMGSDGLDGAIEISNSGNDCDILLESEETAVVYGMPKKIAESELVTNKKILPLDEIKHQLNQK